MVSGSRSGYKCILPRDARFLVVEVTRDHKSERRSKGPTFFGARILPEISNGDSRLEVAR